MPVFCFQGRHYIYLLRHFTVEISFKNVLEQRQLVNLTVRYAETRGSYGLNYDPQNAYNEALFHDVVIFGDRIFKGVIKIKWGHTGRTLIQYDSCPYKKGKTHEGCTLIEKRPWEDTKESWPSARQERGLRRNQPCQHLGLGLPATRTMRK